MLLAHAGPARGACPRARRFLPVRSYAGHSWRNERLSRRFVGAVRFWGSRSRVALLVPRRTRARRARPATWQELPSSWLHALKPRAGSISEIFSNLATTTSYLYMLDRIAPADQNSSGCDLRASTSR